MRTLRVNHRISSFRRHVELCPSAGGWGLRICIIRSIGILALCAAAPIALPTEIVDRIRDAIDFVESTASGTAAKDRGAVLLTRRAAARLRGRLNRAGGRALV